MGSYTYYDYDINARLTRVANHKSDTSVISTFDYTLDPVGNRIAMQINSGDTVYYEYDGIYQLVKEDRRESDNDLVYINYFEYDLSGNRTHLHYVDDDSDDWTYYTYNIENQLTIEEKGGVATYYTYDAAGALINKVTGEDESTYDYTYEGQMDEFASGDDTAYYIYDADKKRVQAKRNGTVEKYALSGNDVVADYNGEDTLVATYNTPTLDSNVTKKVGENVYFFTKDGLGSIRNILDSDETAQNTYDYKAFGAVYGSPTENISNRYRYTARAWESIPPIHYYRARMMDQSLGRFFSKDPIFYPNMYTYGANNPVKCSDPLGKQVCFSPKYADLFFHLLLGDKYFGFQKGGIIKLIDSKSLKLEIIGGGNEICGYISKIFIGSEIVGQGNEELTITFGDARLEFKALKNIWGDVISGVWAGTYLHFEECKCQCCLMKIDISFSGGGSVKGFWRYVDAGRIDALQFRADPKTCGDIEITDVVPNKAFEFGFESLFPIINYIRIFQGLRSLISW